MARALRIERVGGRYHATARGNERSKYLPRRHRPVPLPGVGAAGGLIGVTFCPGKCAASTLGEAWARDVALGVDVIAAWGTQAVVSLIEDHEFDLLKVRDLGPAIRSRGMAWHHLPIEDVHVPDQRFHQAWPGVAPDLVGRLRSGGRVVVHCRGGLGRSGLVAALLVIEFAAEPVEATRAVRASRPGAIETREQERFVAAYRPVVRDRA